MPKLVVGEGPLDAKIVAIGEAPGRDEDYQGRPFVGMSGHKWNRWLTSASLNRREIRVENVVPYRPPGNNIEAFNMDYVAECIENLHQRIASMKDPYVLVPMGNYATFALTGKGKVKAALRRAVGWEDVSASKAEKKAGITRLRGSIYEYRDLNGRRIKVIPALHPAFTLYKGARNEQMEKRCIADWKRIAEDSKFRELLLPRRNHVVDPAPDDLRIFYSNLSPEMPISIDIETWGKTLSCVGFALSPQYSITLPVVTKEEKELWMPHVKWLCESPNPKILQNGLYDAYWLRDYGIDINNYLWDTMSMHHTIDPVEEHSLHFLASIYTRQPYWKDEAKDAEEIIKYTSNLEALWVYNGQDCCVTYEVWTVLLRELEAQGMLDFYHNHYSSLFQVLLDVMRHGIAVNIIKQKEMSKQLLTECAVIRQDLKERAGEELYAKKDFSNDRLRKFFYKTLGLPEQKKWTKHKEGRAQVVTLDKTALRTLAVRFPEKIGPWGLKVLNHRIKKREAQYLKGAWDKDERIRCQYKFTTEAGRLASSENPMGKGYNLQNVKRGDVRKTFIPDSGCIFVRVDLSQVEDREVKMCTRAPRMVALANLRPNDYDAHTVNAAKIFGISESDVSKKQRYLGKRAVHAAQRGMMGKTLSEKLLEDDYVILPKRCQQMIDKYLDANWEIRDIYFPWVRELMIRDRRLTNSWGRIWDIEYQLLDDDLYRRGYSWKPQAEAADLTNQWGMKAGYRHIKEFGMKTKINFQNHDEVGASCPLDEAYDWASFLVASFEQPRMLYGNVLVVPACVMIGMNWADGVEFKRMPSRQEFDKVAREVFHERT